MRKTHLHSFYEYHDSCDARHCFYCGDIGDCIDHCPPISLMRMYPSVPKILVKACTMCNMALGARPLPTLISRVEHLLKYYTKKYKRILKLPIWTHDEINDLSGTLKNYILAKQNSKEYAQSKLNFIQSNLEKLLEK